MASPPIPSGQIVDTLAERLVEQSADGIFVLDGKLHFVAVNAATCDMLGYTRDELLRMRLGDVNAPDSKKLPDLTNPGERIRAERVLLRKDGSRVEVEAHVTLLDDGLIQGMARDISRRRGVERELKASVRLLAAIREVQAEYIEQPVAAVPPYRLFLEHMVDLLGCELGFVCEVIREAGHRDTIHWVTRAGEHYVESTDHEASLLDHGRLERLLNRLEATPELHVELDDLPLEIEHGTGLDATHDGFRVVALRDRTSTVGIVGVIDQVDLAPPPAAMTTPDKVRAWRAASPTALSQLVPLLDTFAGIVKANRTARAHQAAEAEAARLARILDHASNEILVFDGEMMNVEQANGRARENLGFTSDELKGMTPLGLLPQIGATHFQSMLDMLRVNEQEQVTFETTVRRKDNTVYPVDVSLQIANPDEAEVFVAIMQDISIRKQAEARASYLVNHDRLTGLPNRLGFIDCLDGVLDDVRRDGGQVAVLFIDLDRFQIINDTLGHDAGDNLLKDVTERLMPCLRAGDTFARLGGDEFTAILPRISPDTDVPRICNALLAALQEPFQVAEQEIFTSASIGVTIFPNDATDIGGLLKNADTALAHAKQSGRDTWRFFTPDMNARAIERLAMENELRRALERGELVIHYQPQVDLKLRKIVAVEALLRWQHPRLGLVAPGSFIPLAEETGLIVALGEWVLRNACEEVHRWHQAGHRGIRVAVNLSARQMVESILPTLHATVLQTGIDPRCVELELTESLVMEDNPTNIQALHALQTFGISFSIDDFGTGYSSLAYLKRLPIDTLKIDRSFVRDVMRDPDDAAITKAIIAMAHGLGIRVIAEGVETLAQLEFLEAHACDAIQGYYFSPPVPAEMLRELLATGRGLD